MRASNDESSRLLLRLLDLAIAEHDPDAVIQDALALVLEACRARVAYLELRDGDAIVFERGAGDQPSLASLRAATSSTIAATVLATGTAERTVAVVDPRFTDLDSVRRNAITAVLCAPIGMPAIGVLYLQRRDAPDPFDDHDLALVELFAKVVTKFAIPLLLGAARPLSADTDDAEARRIRAALRRHPGNKQAAADELGLDRSTLYRKMKRLGIE